MFFVFLLHTQELKEAFDTHVRTALAWSYSHCFLIVLVLLSEKKHVPVCIWKHETRRPLPLHQIWFYSDFYLLDFEHLKMEGEVVGTGENVDTVVLLGLSWSLELVE